MSLTKIRNNLQNQSIDSEEISEIKIKDFRYENEIGGGSSLKLTHRQKILNALLDKKSGNFPAWKIGLKINDCSKNSLCNHPLCPFCRHKHQIKSSTEVNGLFASSNPSDLHFVTILLDVTYDISEVTNEYISTIKRKWNNLIGRRAQKDERYKGITWWGAFEVDVKLSKYVKGERPLRTMSDLGMDVSRNQHCFLPHLHLVVNLNGVTKDEFKKDLKSLWDKSYQVRVQIFHGEKTTEENLTNLAMYMTKFRVQYSENLDTGSDPEEIDIDNEEKDYKRTQYKDLYEPDMIRKFAIFLSEAGTFNRISFKTQPGKKKSTSATEEGEIKDNASTEEIT